MLVGLNRLLILFIKLMHAFLTPLQNWTGIEGK